MVIGGAIRRPISRRRPPVVCMSVRAANAGEPWQTFGDSQSVRNHKQSSTADVVRA